MLESLKGWLLGVALRKVVTRAVTFLAGTGGAALAAYGLGWISLEALNPTTVRITLDLAGAATALSGGAIALLAGNAVKFASTGGK